MRPRLIQPTLSAETTTANEFLFQMSLFPKFDISHSAEAAALLHTESVGTCF